MMIRISVVVLGLLFSVVPWGAEARPICTVERCTELGQCYINGRPSRCAYESHGASSGALVVPHGKFFIERNLDGRKWGSAKWQVIYGKKQEFRTLGTNKRQGGWNILKLDDGVTVKYPLLPFEK
jgi:hypothetical protein